MRVESGFTGKANEQRMGEGGEGDAGIKETFCALKSGVIQKGM